MNYFLHDKIKKSQTESANYLTNIGGKSMEKSNLEADLKAIKNEYFRNWKRNNPEKVKAINNRFWAKKLQEKNQNGGTQNGK